MALKVRVCRVDEVEPDKLKGFAVAHASWPVMVTRVDGELVAFPGVCPHDDVSLVDYGVREDGEVRCRVHGYRFDLKTGACEHDPRLHLRRYRVTVVDDDVYVDLL